ncbi:hypothetical protein ACFLSQ_04655, partial [Bacteroidota bacterium]
FMFIKKVSGFQNIKNLLRIISETSKNIFWLTSMVVYTWEYLNKTINISDSFGYIVKLCELTDDQIIKVIMKRHRVSGYLLNFDPGMEDVTNKKYKKMRHDEKQNYLKEEFFKKLNKLSQSNISLALLFWVRSTNEVVGNIIKINSLKELDFSFMSMLSIKKVLTLHALLLHEKLNIDSLAEIFGHSKEDSLRIFSILFDDGIILRDQEYYTINPLLYRQNVDLLRSKNFIH